MEVEVRANRETEEFLRRKQGVLSNEWQVVLGVGMAGIGLQGVLSNEWQVVLGVGTNYS